jgi:anaphase-promoting complex subunit 4
MVFTLRTGIDFLFQEFKPEDSEEVSVMVVGTENGGVHLSIYDSFSVGQFRYDSGDHDGQLIGHASHPDVPTHAMLFKPTADGATKVLDLVPLDLSFIVSSPINLSLLASKLTTLQKLLRYLKQAFLHMQVEYKNTRELPTKFLGVIRETLQEPESVGPQDIVASLYHTMVTGHVYPPVKEWLVDNLAERVSFPSHFPTFPPLTNLIPTQGPQKMG